MQSQRRLIGEIEIVDRLEKRKVGLARQSREGRLLPMRDFLGGEQSEEFTVDEVRTARIALVRSASASAIRV